MGTYTPNLNLYKPDPSDDYEDFLPEFNDNMDKLDNSGGGSGGHTIVDPNDSDMPAESKLQFTGNVTVTDDSLNGKTIVDIPASSGSGHTIINPSGTSMTQRNGLKFTGNVTVTDDSGNNETVVNIMGGGGSVNYSLTEQVIGTWIDGKPLYEKTYVQHSTDASGNYINFDVSDLQIDTCVSIRGTCDRIVPNVGILIYEFNSYENSTYNTYLAYSKFNGVVQYTVRFNYGGGESTSFQCITIQYTKTTD